MPDVVGVARLIIVGVAVVGVVVGLQQLYARRKQRRRDFADHFVQRYSKIMDNLSPEAIESTKPDGGVVSTSDRKAVVAFLNLSEDELDLRDQGWISMETWRLWRAGMAADFAAGPRSRLG